MDAKQQFENKTTRTRSLCRQLPSSVKWAAQRRRKTKMWTSWTVGKRRHHGWVNPACRQVKARTQWSRKLWMTQVSGPVVKGEGLADCHSMMGTPAWKHVEVRRWWMVEATDNAGEMADLKKEGVSEELSFASLTCWTENPSSHTTVCFNAVKLLHSWSIRVTGVWLFTLSKFGESSLQAGKLRTQWLQNLCMTQVRRLIWKGDSCHIWANRVRRQMEVWTRCMQKLWMTCKTTDVRRGG